MDRLVRPRPWTRMMVVGGGSGSGGEGEGEGEEVEVVETRSGEDEEIVFAAAARCVMVFGWEASRGAFERDEPPSLEGS